MLFFAEVTRVPLDRQQVVGDAPHGLQGGVGDLVGGEDDVLRVAGAAPGQDGDGVRPPSLQRPVAHVDVELHVGKPHLHSAQITICQEGESSPVWSGPVRSGRWARRRARWTPDGGAPSCSERAASRRRTS